MQTRLHLATKEQLSRSWAFAVSPRRQGRAVITSVSREARRMGIEVGMHCEEARQLLPGLRIFVYGGR
jgi:hypothetical protein